MDYFEPIQTFAIHPSIACHFRKWERGFESRGLNEKEMEKVDDTHFVFDMGDGKSLVFKGDKEVP